MFPVLSSLKAELLICNSLMICITAIFSSIGIVGMSDQAVVTLMQVPSQCSFLKYISSPCDFLDTIA